MFETIDLFRNCGNGRKGEEEADRELFTALFPVGLLPVGTTRGKSRKEGEPFFQVKLLQ